MGKIKISRPYKDQRNNLLIVLSVLSLIILITVVANIAIFGTVIPERTSDKLGVWTSNTDV